MSMTPSLVRILLIGTFTAMLTAAASSEPREFKPLHYFKGGTDGATPITALALDKDGALYGGTEAGGLADCSAGCGTIYSLTPNGASFDYKVIHRFPGAGGGTTRSVPNELIRGGDGSLYAATYQGGTAGLGTVYRLNPPAIAGSAWDYQELYQFTNAGGDGRNPSGALVALAGELYGVTENGGSSGFGTFFKVTRLGVKTTLYNFAGPTADARKPIAIISDRAGGFFGVSSLGGVKNSGTVFHLTLAANGVTWRSRVIYSFERTSGREPVPAQGLLRAKDGSLYGFTEDGGKPLAGNAYRLAPRGANAWTYSEIFAFHTQLNGNGPVGAPVMNKKGAIYGMTNLLGSPEGYGTAFKLTEGAANKPWTFTRLIAFMGDASYEPFDVRADTRARGNNLGVPAAGFVIDNAGKLYGTTMIGGNDCPNARAFNTCGAVIAVEP